MVCLLFDLVSDLVVQSREKLNDLHVNEIAPMPETCKNIMPVASLNGGARNRGGKDCQCRGADKSPVGTKFHTEGKPNLSLVS